MEPCRRPVACNSRVLGDPYLAHFLDEFCLSLAFLLPLVKCQGFYREMTESSYLEEEKCQARACSLGLTHSSLSGMVPQAWTWCCYVQKLLHQQDRRVADTLSSAQRTTPLGRHSRDWPPRQAPRAPAETMSPTHSLSHSSTTLRGHLAPLSCAITPLRRPEFHSLWAE